MYHALVEKTSGKLHRVHVTKELFRQEMEWLAKEGYRTITLNEMLEDWSSKIQGKFCVITFDDGYHSLYRFAMPVLKQYNFKATLYLTTGAVGQKDFNALKSLNPGILPASDRPLTWEEVMEMSANGWSVQSHSVSHSDHSKISKEQMKYEMSESKKIIESYLRQPVLHYAFPFGKYNAQTLKLAKEAGYQSAATVHQGMYTSKKNVYRLPRLEMNCYDNLSFFSKKIESGFISPKERLRSTVRNIIFSNPLVKDWLKKLFGRRIN